MSVERLHPDDVTLIADALAESVAPLLADAIADRLRDSSRSDVTPATGAGADAFLDARQVAERFKLSRRWVYDHADRLGAIPVGDGERPRLRFDPARVAEALGARSTGKGSPVPEAPQRRRSRRLHAVPGSPERPLLPIRAPRDV